MQKNYRIAVLPGDGIGPDVIREGVNVLRAVESRFDGVKFEFSYFSVGAAEYLKNGNPLPPETLQSCREADAILLGAMGLPDVRWPDGVEMTPQLNIREQLDLYSGLRPIRLFHENDTPLKTYRTGEIDFVIVRESTEGLFSGRLAKANSDDSERTDTLRITRHGSERIIRAAIREAQRRKGLVTLVDKSNVLPSMAFFRSIFDEVCSEFPSVKTERIYVDAAALYLVRKPQAFDVIVTENMFGDILSDLAAGLIGGMGMAPSADIGDRHAVFQPSHGSAPDIAGKDIANPIATILSVALMLDWFEHSETRRGAAQIREAVQTVFNNPENRTPDMGGTLGTAELSALVLREIRIQ